jgi:hypothetical protein
MRVSRSSFPPYLSSSTHPSEPLSNSKPYTLTVNPKPYALKPPNPQVCRELVGILPEDEWYREYVLTGLTGEEGARVAVCDAKGQACHKHPTERYIKNFVKPENHTPFMAPTKGNKRKEDNSKNWEAKKAKKGKAAKAKKGVKEEL